MSVHPSASHWVLPPAREPLPPPLERTNLRRLMSREGRFEHHLTVVARIGAAQLEVVAASEPLFFAHQNISDELVIGLKTGDALVDGMPMRTFLTDPESDEDVARLRHRAHDLILHPHGLSHWPGRLRAPHEPPAFPPGVGRRTGLSLVFCASRPTAPPLDRRAWVTEGREADAKPYRAPAPPLLIAELDREPEGPLAVIDDVTLALASPPFAPTHGGWVVLLEGDTADGFAGDLVRVPPGESFTPPVERALLVSSARAEPEPIRDVWSRPPDGPFEETPAAQLPVAIGELTLSELSDGDVSDGEIEARLDGHSARVPRYWLARMLHRIALHTTVADCRRGPARPCLGHVQTYGGLFYDDRDGAFRFGLRGAPTTTTIAPERWVETLAAAYAAVAPEGHTEDLR